MPADERRYEYVEAEHGYELRDAEAFDRIAFAMAALRRLRPNVTVVVYERVRDLRVERGLDPASGQVALLGIPPHASREHIAFEIASLAGMADRPWVLSALLGFPQG